MEIFMTFCLLSVSMALTSSDLTLDLSEIDIQPKAPKKMDFDIILDEKFVAQLADLASCLVELSFVEDALTQLNHSDNKSRGRRDVVDWGNSNLPKVCFQPPVLPHAQMTWDENEAEYVCERNFRFYGPSQSAHCIEGKWKFVSDFSGTCRRSLWSALNGEFETALVDLSPGTVITVTAKAGIRARFLIRIESKLKKRVLVEYDVDLGSDSATTDSQLEANRNPDTRQQWTTNPIETDRRFILKIYVLKECFKCEVDGVEVDRYPVVTSLFTATHLTASGDIHVNEVAINYPQSPEENR